MIPERARYYHGTHADLKPGDEITPCDPPEVGEPDSTARYVHFAPDLDAALWAAELSDGEGPARVYVVEAIGPIEDVRKLPGRRVPNPREPSWPSARVPAESTSWNRQGQSKMIRISRTGSFAAIRRSRTARCNRCGSRARSRIGRATRPTR